ncbi:MAG TPA: hypothetical protein VKD72_38605 [Gemmataceae bacterium]|nr:hypothetical protein [Gemmataceae bacterium]
MIEGALIEKGCEAAMKAAEYLRVHSLSADLDVLHERLKENVTMGNSRSQSARCASRRLSLKTRSTWSLAS